MYVCTDTCVNVSVFVGVCLKAVARGGGGSLGSEEPPHADKERSTKKVH